MPIKHISVEVHPRAEDAPDEIAVTKGSLAKWMLGGDKIEVDRNCDAYVNNLFLTAGGTYQIPYVNNAKNVRTIGQKKLLKKIREQNAPNLYTRPQNG
jgi:hypothetical protein